MAYRVVWGGSTQSSMVKVNTEQYGDVLQSSMGRVNIEQYEEGQHKAV